MLAECLVISDMSTRHNGVKSVLSWLCDMRVILLDKHCIVIPFVRP